ncbi:MAG: Nudix family hydrolase [Cellvibrionaceae bacterium]
MNSYVHVAVGVIRDLENKVLLAKRRDEAHQGGLWEFPGGKVEADESVQVALRRELAEELGIHLTHSLPLIQVRHHYSDKSVLLDVWEIDSYRGSPRGNEGQPLQWLPADQLETGTDCLYPLPAANAAIIKALQLPHALLITGEFDSKADFQARLERALRGGIRLVQFRPCRSTDALSEFELKKLLEFAAALCLQHQARLVVSASIGLAPTASQGVHLPAKQLMACRNRPVSAKQLLGASCHNREELQQAAELEVDYVVLSPVSRTVSHPGVEPLGWEQFESLVKTVNIPVFALGGLSQTDLPKARTMGGQGIAAISALWEM